jgi:hypothetical protein
MEKIGRINAQKILKIPKIVSPIYRRNLIWVRRRNSQRKNTRKLYGCARYVNKRHT